MNAEGVHGLIILRLVPFLTTVDHSFEFNESEFGGVAGEYLGLFKEYIDLFDWYSCSSEE